VSIAGPPQVASITDFDGTRLMQVAPGKLLTLYGAGLAPADAAQPSNHFPTSFNGVTVAFNGVAAPILYSALALNQDGSANSCSNPAESGSTVTIFLNGLGVTTPSLGTGAISTSQVSLSPSALIAAPWAIPGCRPARFPAPSRASSKFKLLYPRHHPWNSRLNRGRARDIGFEDWQ
jgi:hypothetical protein